MKLIFTLMMTLNAMIAVDTNAAGAKFVCRLEKNGIPMNCTVWESNLGSSGSMSPVIDSDPIGCPRINGPSAYCFRVLYCKDASGNGDYCRREDQTGPNSFSNTASNSNAAKCLLPGFIYVKQNGKDKCIKAVLPQKGPPKLK